MVPELINRLPKRKIKITWALGHFQWEDDSQSYKNGRRRIRENISFGILGVFPVRISAKFFQLKCNRASFKPQRTFSPYNQYIMFQQNTDPVNYDLTVTDVRVMERETWDVELHQLSKRNFKLAVQYCWKLITSAGTYLVR